jgi:hypothetical protein
MEAERITFSICLFVPCIIGRTEGPSRTGPVRIRLGVGVGGPFFPSDKASLKKRLLFCGFTAVKVTYEGLAVSSCIARRVHTGLQCTSMIDLKAQF